MKFSLLVLANPYSSQGSLSALKFAKAAINQGHEIYRVFFYHDGVHSGSNLQSPAQDELNIQANWSAFSKTHNTDLVICIAAALKRGVLNQEEAQRYEKNQFNLDDAFELSGLGQLLDAQIHSDRVVTFK
ncbi:sulfurtransferase complex subunit TusD [Oceaniserpentilla sp. 4NH20-0058]|uniref:sulfurtransferase complex subunit TusD n=1 Tax=Oceaniserpentilla sp. 4NH20-0058 TaxID=3127660 RepID=UPI003105C2CF